MVKTKNIFSFFLLAAYLLVMLHNFTPHFHVDGSHLTGIETTHAEHHQHDHGHHHHSHEEHSEDNRSDSENNLFHSLNHLFAGFYHAAAGEDHLTHITTDNSFSQTKLKVVYTFLTSRVLPPVNIVRETEVPYYFSPPNEQLLTAAVPLRAPPAFIS